MKSENGLLWTAAAVLLAVTCLAGCGQQADASTEDVSQDGTTVPVLEGGLDMTVEDFRLSLDSDGTLLSVSLSAPTTGWVAVGFEPSAAMKDANIVIGYVADGEAFVRDDWGTGHTSHEPDTELGGTDDVSGVSGSESDGVTTLSFTIPLDSGDEFDRMLSTGNTYDVMIAYGRDEADDFEGFHRWAKIVEVEF